MALNFPDSPSNGDTTTLNGVEFTYNSTSTQWNTAATTSGGGSSVTVSDTAPTSPSAGDQWFDSSSLTMFVYYADGSSSQWVPAAPAGQTGQTGEAGAAGTAASNPTPTITSVTPASYNGVDATTFTIVGTNFTVGTVVDFITAGGVVHRATTTTVVDQANLTGVTPQAFVEADGPLDVKITVSGGANVTTTDAIQTGGSPVWTTAAGNLSGGVGTLGASDNAYRLDSSVAEQITAADPEGQTVSYQITSGALPAGVTLAGNTGAITGTTAATLSGDTTYSFTGFATDTSGNGTARVFSIIVKNELGMIYAGFSDVYTQANSSYFTFHPCGRTGPLGPTLNPAQHAYGYQSTNTWVANSSYFNINDGDGSTAGGLNTAGVQIWTCPQSGTYKINMAGACGMGSKWNSDHALGGRGAIMTGTVNLTMNQKYAIVAGQIGGMSISGDSPNYFSNAVTGSGASAIWTNNLVTGSDYTNSNVKWDTTPNNRSTQQFYVTSDQLFTTGGGASFIAEWDDSTGIGLPVMVAGGGGSLRNGNTNIPESDHSSLSAARTYDYSTFAWNTEINTTNPSSYKSYNAVGWNVSRAGDGQVSTTQTPGGNQSNGEGGAETGAYQGINNAFDTGGAGWNTGPILSSGTLSTVAPLPYLAEALKNGGRGGIPKETNPFFGSGGFGGGGAGGWGGSSGGGGYAGGGEAGNSGGIGGGGSSYKKADVTLSNVGLGDSGNHHEGFVQVQFVS